MDSLDFPMPIATVSRNVTSPGCALVPVVPTLRWLPLPHQRKSRVELVATDSDPRVDPGNLARCEGLPRPPIAPLPIEAT